MEKKENKTRLRLVKTDEPMANKKMEAEESPIAGQRSRFAQQMNGFADELDRMIELILRS